MLTALLGPKCEPPDRRFDSRAARDKGGRNPSGRLAGQQRDSRMYPSRGSASSLAVVPPKWRAVPGICPGVPYRRSEHPRVEA